LNILGPCRSIQQCLSKCPSVGWRYQCPDDVSIRALLIPTAHLPVSRRSVQVVGRWAVGVAYFTLLASVADEQVVAFREETKSALVADLSRRCSHALTSWVHNDDLRNLLRLSIDGGQVLRPDLWHPLRVPAWHPSVTTAEIEPRLRRVWSDISKTAGPLDPSDWYGIEIGKVLEVFAHAAAVHNGVVSFLEPPTDEARANQVLIPASQTDPSK
jgi:hypothetical protein